jgi:hypothetical protein
MRARALKWSAPTMKLRFCGMHSGEVLFLL